MVKKSACMLLTLLCLLHLTGCWNYRGLNEMTVVAGMAVDRDPKNGKYLLTFEFVDISTPVKERGASGELIQSEGETFFDAVRDAKRRLSNKLYFGHNQIVVLSREIASSEDVVSLLDWLLRDGECRETLYVAISQGETAREVFDVDGADQKLVSYKLQMVIREDKRVTGSTLPVELYELYEVSKSPGRELALPAVHRVESGEELVTEINGMAVFRKEKLVGFLSPEDAKYYLFAVNRFENGVLPFHDPESGEARGTLEVGKSKTQYDIEVEGGEVKLIVKPKLTVFMGELMETDVKLDVAKLDEITRAAEKELEEKISGVIRKIQTEFQSDILNFGNLIYKRNYALWTELEDTWDEKFPTLKVEVRVDINVSNSALLSGT
ncbi:MAG TPA: Ger(x)C family spore germination protein [Pseudoflavonifractor sp.]|nr:Ger(x)C family spore germination protein [Pseudoflavonifractor sp.]